jgi:hypothetical protein
MLGTKSANRPSEATLSGAFKIDPVNGWEGRGSGLRQGVGCAKTTLPGFLIDPVSPVVHSIVRAGPGDVSGEPAASRLHK